jgi:hypothetical protein
MERVLPTMRTLLAGLTVLGLLAAPAGHAQETPASGQRFRSGIDLITIDVSAVDRDGRPVEDLRPRDLRVKIDGREREIVSVELVKVDTSRAGEPPPVEAPLISANLIPDQGRRLVVAVDQTLIRPGSAALLIRTAGEFGRPRGAGRPEHEVRVSPGTTQHGRTAGPGARRPHRGPGSGAPAAPGGTGQLNGGVS